MEGAGAMLSMKDGANPRSGHARQREVASALGIIGLAVTLVFNTIGVWQGVQHEEQARDTEQIALLTQLNSNATDTEREINATGAPQRECEPHRHLTRQGDTALLAALDYYEYLAWLFNGDRLTITNSRAFFGQRMIDGWRLARRYLGGDVVSHNYVELTRFVHESPREDWPPNDCVVKS